MKVQGFWRNFLLVSTCMALILTAGCLRGQQSGQPDDPVPAVVEVWHYLQGAEADVLQVQAQRIMENYSEVLIELKYVPGTNFVNFSYQAAAGGEGPEIFIASQEVIRQLYERGLLAKAAYVDQNAYPATLAAFQFEGAHYASPWLTDAALLYFRTDLAVAPVSLDDLFLNKGGISLAAADTSSLAVWWEALGGRSVSAGVPALTDQANVDFLYQLLTWQGAGSLRIDSAALSSFAEGQTLYMLAGASQAQFLTRQSVPWGSIQLSDLVSGQGRPFIGATFGIANSAIKTSEALLPAIQIVEKELLTPEAEGALWQAGRLLPANREFYRLPEAQKGVFPQAETALNKAWVLEGNALEWKVIPWQDAAWSKVLAGESASEAALATAQESVLEELAPK